MNADQVLEVWALSEAHGLEVCIDGGWAVDALLEEQTRAHGDLDIALPAARMPELRRLLAGRGFVEVPRPDSWEHNFVLERADGAAVDVHSYVLNPDGSNRGGVPYIADHLTGWGRILGRRVRCVPPRHLVDFHTGYEVDKDDWQDVRRLCERFGIPVPPIYSRFQSDESNS